MLAGNPVIWPYGILSFVSSVYLSIRRAVTVQTPETVAVPVSGIEDEFCAVSSLFREEFPVPKASFYKPELDVLRFFAFFGVFVTHFMNRWDADISSLHNSSLTSKIVLSLVHAGAYGVDLFFVLSAYLITELLLREKEIRGSLDVRAFYIRRILRIWPLYYLFVISVMLFPFIDPHRAFVDTHFSLPFLCMMGNWSFVLFGWPGSVAVPLWSVSVEEQFYLLWPPVVARLTRHQIVIIAVLLIVISNLVRLMAVAMHESTQQLWGNTFAHMDSIAIGILLAVMLSKKEVRLSYKFRIALMAAGIICLMLRGYFVANRPDEQLTWLGTSIGYPAVVFACTSILVCFIGLPWRFPLLEYLGKISFGLYVYHMLSISITDRVMPGGGPWYDCIKFLLAFGITAVISSISYTVLEKPFLKLKRRFTYVESRMA
jgi:peptidoglycan/LPS O-acetylase OafA/YrhL